MQILTNITHITRACFIERASEIRPPNKMLINQWLAVVGPVHNGKEPTYEDYMKIEIVSAWNKNNQVWQAILDTEHIWCQSYFIGESANLFVNMLELAIREGITNKYFFNLAERWEAIHHLLSVRRDIKAMMRQLECSNNIKFFFWEEIEQMMHAKHELVLMPDKGTKTKSK